MRRTRASREADFAKCLVPAFGAQSSSIRRVTRFRRSGPRSSTSPTNRSRMQMRAAVACELCVHIPCPTCPNHRELGAKRHARLCEGDAVLPLMPGLAGQAGHALAEPRRHAAAMQRQVGGSGTGAHELIPVRMVTVCS